MTCIDLSFYSQQLGEQGPVVRTVRPQPQPYGDAMQMETQCVTPADCTTNYTM